MCELRARFAGAIVIAAVALPAAAQAQQAVAPEPVPSAAPPTLRGPVLRAVGVPIPLSVGGAPAGGAVELQRRLGGARWVTIKTAMADADGEAKISYEPQQRRPRYRLRVTAAGLASRGLTVRTRPVTLAAFGDSNFGDGVGAVMAQRGPLWPWSGVATTLRHADIAFGNLECAITDRGAAVPKEYNFRGRPDHLEKVVRYAGLDVLNLANNHAGDFGMLALLDTVRSVRRAGALPVGAGATLALAQRPQVVTRLGLRVAFVGFSDIGPASFFARPGTPGTSSATLPAIVAGVRAASRRADVVIATFHWGIERALSENARQRAFAHAALRAGATAVIAAHPHVLQPIRRVDGGRRLVAYSLGNFVWSAGSAASSSTGILRVGLSARGIESHRLLRARIDGTRPRLIGDS